MTTALTAKAICHWAALTAKAIVVKSTVPSLPNIALMAAAPLACPYCRATSAHCSGAASACHDIDDCICIASEFDHRDMYWTANPYVTWTTRKTTGTRMKNLECHGGVLCVCYITYYRMFQHFYKKSTYNQNHNFLISSNCILFAINSNTYISILKKRTVMGATAPASPWFRHCKLVLHICIVGFHTEKSIIACHAMGHHGAQACSAWAIVQHCSTSPLGVQVSSGAVGKQCQGPFCINATERGVDSRGSGGADDQWGRTKQGPLPWGRTKQSPLPWGRVRQKSCPKGRMRRVPLS